MSFFAEGIWLSYFHGLIVLSLLWLLCRFSVALRPGSASGFVRQAMGVMAMLALFAFLPIPNFTANLLSNLAARTISTPETREVANERDNEKTTDSMGITLTWENLRLAGVDSSREQGRPNGIASQRVNLLSRLLVGVSVLCLLRQCVGLISLWSRP